jgi:hypothetical protein
MLTFVQRTLGVALLMVSACAFEGAEGEPEAPPGPQDELVEEGPLPDPVTAPIPIPGATACGGFAQVGGSHYLISATPFDWDGALAYCATLPGAYLATFEMASTSGELVAAMPLAGPVWTAVEQKVGRRTGVRDGWGNLLLDKRSKLPDAFPWLQGEPNDGNGWYIEDRHENVAILRPDGKFDDNNRARTYPALCECVPSVE